MNTSEKPQANTMEYEKAICSKHGVEMEAKFLDAAPGMRPWRFDFCDLCSKEAEEAEIAAQERRALEEKRHIEEKANEGIPRKYRGSRLSDFTNIDPVLEWVNNPKGFLFVHGQCGSGKTHLACAIKYHFNSLGVKSGIEFSSNLFINLRNSFNSKDHGKDSSEFAIIKKYAPDPTTMQYSAKHFGDIEVDYTHTGIFDDVGAQKISDYVIEAWYNIIDRRYMYEHPTMFTSNLSLKEISIVMSDRIASRLASGINFELKGPDRRLSK